MTTMSDPGVPVIFKAADGYYAKLNDDDDTTTDGLVSVFDSGDNVVAQCSESQLKYFFDGSVTP